MKKIFLGLMACAALCACTSDDALVDNLANAEVKDGLYMKFKLETSSTRSTTEDPEGGYVVSSDGTEEGTDAENNVKTITVILTDEDGEFIAMAKEYEGTSSTYYVATFEATEINAFAGKTVDVHVYCNVPETFDGKEVAEIYGDDETELLATAWADNAFFMSNAKEAAVELEEDLSPYKDISNPYNIGTVYVERSVARMDYKDGADTENDGAFTYPMMVDEETGDAQINLVLTDMALINMSNEFYFLRHMAASTDENYDTADLTDIELLSPETQVNWVIDTDAETKMSYNGEDLSANFTYPLQSPLTWIWESLADICTSDNLDNRDDLQYHPWRYLTENTIPSIAAQQNGISTGVVFKAQIVPTNDCPQDLATAFETGERIFAFANEIVGTWDMVVTFATTESNYDTALAAAYRNVMGQLEEGYTKAELSAAQAAEGFTGFSPTTVEDAEGSDYAYYCYYYYWNRHNDNLQNGVMGTMEFDVVRNNVYKLSVTGISLFGHPTPVDPDDPDYDPTDPDPDPDPVEPNDPDEEDNLYIQVSVQVLPWVVRVNNIEF